MPPHLGPLRFEPFLRPMVWGGRALADRLGKTPPGDGPIGEAWEVSDHPLHRGVVADGAWRGTTLRQLMEQQGPGLLGSAADRFTSFPWLFKFLDCRDWLSVQVHPDAAAVKTLWPGEGSKTEAWYVVHAEPWSRIYAGLRAGVGPDELRRAVAAGTVAECLHAFTPRAGDCVFLPAGTVHAVGGGVLIAEIQETSDATFRLFDWNRVDASGRPRQLHVEQAFAAIHWDYGPVTPRRVPSDLEGGRAPLTRCDSFHLDFLRAAQRWTVEPTGRLRLLAVLEGRGRWRDGQSIAAGQVWVLPAALPAAAIELDEPLAGLLAELP